MAKEIYSPILLKGFTATPGGTPSVGYSYFYLKNDQLTIKGPSGETIASGTQGPQGSAGAGSQGLQGPQGLQGSTGSNGSNGSQGPQGLAGTQGVQGSQGYGPTGSASTLLSTSNRILQNFILIPDYVLSTGATATINNLANGPYINHDGKYQFQAMSDSALRVSSDYGLSWGIGLTGYYPSVSKTGEYMAYVNHYGLDMRCLRSSDYGVSFTAGSTFSGLYNQLTISGNGKYALLYSYGTAVGMGLYVSSDYGNTFAHAGVTAGWYDAKINESGQYMLAVGNTNSYYSTNYGIGWSAIGVGTHDCDVSDSGQYMTIVTQNGYVRSSQDYGSSWIIGSSSSTFASRGIAMSGDGSLQIVPCDNTPHKMFVSTNYGIGWTHSGATGASGYSGIQMSGDGKLIISSAPAFGYKRILLNADQCLLSRTGVNVYTPTALLHLAAGSTFPGTAPLKLSTVSNALNALMTTPEPGAIEYNGSSLFFTDSTSTRHEVAPVAFADIQWLGSSFTHASGSTAHRVIKNASLTSNYARNIGMSASLGRITVGATYQVGYYEVSFTLTGSMASGGCNIYLIKNGTDNTTNGTVVAKGIIAADIASTYPTASGCAIVYLALNDYVEIYSGDGSTGTLTVWGYSLCVKRAARYN